DYRPDYRRRARHGHRERPGPPGRRAPARTYVTTPEPQAVSLVVPGDQALPRAPIVARPQAGRPRHRTAGRYRRRDHLLGARVLARDIRTRPRGHGGPIDRPRLALAASLAPRRGRVRPVRAP